MVGVIIQGHLGVWEMLTHRKNNKLHEEQRVFIGMGPQMTASVQTHVEANCVQVHLCEFDVFVVLSHLATLPQEQTVGHSPGLQTENQ